jgi:hypothetical protein
MELESVDAKIRWGSWSFKKTIWVGLVVVLIAAVLRGIAMGYSGIESTSFELVDSAGIIALIIIASKRNSSIIGKVVVAIIILFLGYLLSVVAYFGFLAAIGISLANAA